MKDKQKKKLRKMSFDKAKKKYEKKLPFELTPRTFDRVKNDVERQQPINSMTFTFAATMNQKKSNVFKVQLLDKYGKYIQIIDVLQKVIKREKEDQIQFGLLVIFKKNYATSKTFSKIFSKEKTASCVEGIFSNNLDGFEVTS